MASPDRLSIVHVTPYPWGAHHEVNDFVAGAARELAARGHRVVVAAPGGSLAEVRRTTTAIEEAAGDPAVLFDGWEGERAGPGGPPLLSVAPAIPLPAGARPRPAPVPVDAGGALESLLTAMDFDIVHVHDPFAPSLSSAALRQSWTLNAATFHLPTERVLSTQVARPLVEIFFGRLDARMVSGRSTAELLNRFFPGHYDLVAPAAESDEGVAATAERGDGRTPRITYCVREERGALRLFIRALRRLPMDVPWEADVLLEEDVPAPRINRALRERVRFHAPGEANPDELIAQADIVCATSGGPRPAPSLVRKALAGGAVPVAAQIDPYVELLEVDGPERGFLFPQGDPETLAGQILRLLRNADLRRAMAEAGRGSSRSLGRRRRRPRGDLRAHGGAAPRSRRQARGVEADLPPADDRLRPPHAHRPLGGLRDARGGAGRDGQGPRHGRDRRHRPQRDLRRAAGA